MPLPNLKKLVHEGMRRFSAEVTNVELVPLESKNIALTQTIKYHHGLKYPLMIRLEFSLREKPLTHQVSPIETPFPIAPYPLVVHMDKEELLAEKVRALLTRHKGRDLFDLWFFLTKEVALRKDYIQQKMEWYKEPYLFSDLASAVERFGEKDLINDLGKFLPRNYRSFIRELKTRTLEKLREKSVSL